MKARMHRLSWRYAHIWRSNPDARAMMATKIRELYPDPSEILIVDRRMVACGIISKTGAARLLTGPQPRFPLWRADNNPSPAQCHCRDFFEVDIQAPWSAKQTGKHHPLCQYFPNVALGAMHAVLDDARMKGKASEDIHAALKDAALTGAATPDEQSVTSREQRDDAPKVFT